ncbi:hypothetical protein [Phocaeicola sp.]|uniref:hypothetical protein n=1 Tax=Phocaeicola sp. TaxID=2773926 RepID=UPI00386E8044
MYLLVSTDQLKSRSGRYETMPDGRSIVPMSDQRILGTLKDVDIIPTARELKQLIEEQKKQMEDNNPDIDPGFSQDPDKDVNVDPDFSQDPDKVVEGDGTEDTAGEDESKTETDKKEEEVTDGQTE